MSKYQTRNEAGECKEWDTLEQAFQAAEEDRTIWKISFELAEGTRLRLSRIKGRGLRQNWHVGAADYKKLNALEGGGK